MPGGLWYNQVGRLDISESDYEKPGFVCRHEPGRLYRRWKRGGLNVDNRVFAAACAEYDQRRVEEAVGQMFAAFGGVEKFLQKGKKVLIKPNLLLAREPDGATTTHPAVVGAVAALFVRAGAAVTIADSPGGPYNALTMPRVYRLCGMEKAAKYAKARLNRDFSSQTVRFEGLQPREFELLTPVCRADVVINIGKMKTHMLTYFTGAVKNLFGTVPGLQKAAMHSRLPGQQAFCRMLVDLCRCVGPDFSIIDGVVGMDGRGPSGGRPRRAGVLLAAENPFAADLAAMYICGLQPERSPVHSFAAAQKLVCAEPERIEWLSEPFRPLDEPFLPASGRSRRSESVISRLPGRIRQPLRRVLVAAPHVTERCAGCGACAQACPAHAITVRGGRASVDGRRCIRCYCCHELCPVRAIRI